MNIGQLIYDSTVRGDFATIAANPLAQFGTPARRYLGAELLPEQTVRKNAFTERGISFRTIIANSGARHAPSQRKDGAMVGSMDVRTGNSDIKSVLDSEEYDALVDMLNLDNDMSAVAQMTSFVDTTVNLALVELNEAQRWQAIVNAQVIRTGDNGYTEQVNYPTFAGLRATVAGQWSNVAYDPMADIMTIVRNMRIRGRKITRVIMAESDREILMSNPKIQARLGYAVVGTTGQIQGQPGFVTPEGLDRYFLSQSLPAIETYDLQYHTSIGAGYFLPRGSMVFCSTTARDAQIDLGLSELMPLYNTLGYLAVGRAVGQSAPGRVIQVKYMDDKPPRLVAEGWQESIVVLTEPDAIGVLNGIN